MLTFEKFTGINNVKPDFRLKNSELAVATNVDIGLDGEITRRAGYSQVSADCHKNLWQADGFMLATCNGDLVRTDGATQVVLSESLGSDRVWYCNLPDGRTTFSNGLINGVTDGTTATGWGVPIPPDVGALTPIEGELFPGDYQWAITYVRLADGLEGGPAYSSPQAVPDGGVFLAGLPELDGHKINVYLSSHNGSGLMLAGSTTSGIFSFIGVNSDLALPCRTEHLQPAPVGTVTAFWRGRVLVAKDNVLWASRPFQWELFDCRQDFKQFSEPITLVQPVDGGIFVGTETELLFLAGTQWDALAMSKKINGAVVLGSGVTVPGDQIRLGDRTGSAGNAMLCIADGAITAGMQDGGTYMLTSDTYQTTVTEVAAAFRVIHGVPQYIAIPQ